MAEEPSAKKPKIEEAPADETSESPKELEQDAPQDKRPPLKEDVNVHLSDTTLNVIPTLGGRVLMPISDGGLQYFLAGARANVGVRSGRYCFEVKIVEALHLSEQRGGVRPPQPRQLVRIGFSTQGSSLFLGEEVNSVCFDSEGYYTANKKSVMGSQRFSRYQYIAVVLNLDASSPNKNTLSLFRDGERVSAPQPLPESLEGKTLFPHVNFKNVALHVNWGPTLASKLPFSCKTLQGGAKDDLVVAPTRESKDNKCEVIFPVGLPDEGTFDWLDMFLEKNPQYTELSDRMILDWATKSGLYRTRAPGWKNCNDKPEMNFGLASMDENSVQRVLNSIVAAQPRPYVVMEVKSNLLKDERESLIKRFTRNCYKRVAQVVIGEPPAEFKDRTREALLKEKQDKLESEWRIRLRQAQREKERTPADKAKKDDDDSKVKAVEVEAEKPPVEDDTKKEEDIKEEGKEEVKDEVKDEVKEEIKEEGAKDEEAEKKKDSKADGDMEAEAEASKQGKDGEEEAEEPRPVATLTDEEKTQWFHKRRTTDLNSLTLSSCFPHFTIPEKEEGFEEIRYEWADKSKSSDYLKSWVGKMKLESRMEELQPGEWFKTQWSEWQKVLQEWNGKQNEFQVRNAEDILASKRAALDHADHGGLMGDAQDMADGEVDPALATGGLEGSAEKNGEGGQEDSMDQSDAKGDPVEGSAEAKNVSEGVEEEEEVDVMAVEDINNFKGGEPLYAKFSFEDWALLSLRFEMHLLSHAYRKDTGDPDRIGIHESNLQFYYSKYFRKAVNVDYYGVEDNMELLAMIKDTVRINAESKVVETQLPEEMEKFDLFVKLTEQARLDREKRITGGDELARLKFQRPSSSPAPRSGGYGKSDRKGDKFSDKGDRGKSYGKSYDHRPQTTGGRSYGPASLPYRSSFSGGKGGVPVVPHGMGRSYGAPRHHPGQPYPPPPSYGHPPSGSRYGK
mmetsp:Transcript_115359/g.182267  ORF Transcript_115359/g.182267 Transcript_115359/m.182267 type:complete len:959 (+) Transcript_115359:47-2923(+)